MILSMASLTRTMASIGAILTLYVGYEVAQVLLAYRANRAS